MAYQQKFKSPIVEAVREVQEAQAASDKSPFFKALVGNQDKLPEALKAEILKAAPTKQTTAGEFAHQKHVKDMQEGRATRTVDKVKAAYDAVTTDKTYSEAKQDYRNIQKEKAKKNSSPAKLKDSCYYKVKKQYDVFPSAYASGAIAKCRKNKK